MAESFDVASGALHAHSSGVTGLADELRATLDTAGQVMLTDEAYGQSCQQVVSMLNAVAQAAGQAVQAGVNALESAAANLRDSADAYTDLETGEAGAYSGIAGQLT